MPNRAVFCICNSEAQAMEVVGQLRLAGFTNDDISALLPDRTGYKDFGYLRRTKAPEGALVGGAISGLVCAAVGWLAWVIGPPLSGLQPWLASGPALVSLSSAAVGTMVGGILGAVVGLNIPEYEARRFQGKLPGDNILVSVHCENGRAVRWAKHIFQSGGAAGIGIGPETPAASAGQAAPLAARGTGVG